MSSLSTMIKKSLLITSSLFLLFFVLFLSELIYQVKNTPRELSGKLLSYAEKLSQRDNVQNTVFLMDVASAVHIQENKHRFSNKGSWQLNSELNKLDKETQNEMTAYLTANLTKTNAYNYNTLLARDYYHLGVIALQNNFDKIGEKLLRQSIALSPDSSFLYMELANLYLRIGEIQKASAVLTECQNFENAKEYCSNYFENYLEAARLSKPGDLTFWVEEYLNTN